MIRKVVIYTGHVQGVGFRYTVANLAERYPLAGYVQNLRDGRVRLDVQGKADQVQSLLDDVGREMKRNITAKDETEHPPDESLGDPSEPDAFGIRY